MKTKQGAGLSLASGAKAEAEAAKASLSDRQQRRLMVSPTVASHC